MTPIHSCVRDYILHLSLFILSTAEVVAVRITRGCFGAVLETVVF